MFPAAQFYPNHQRTGISQTKRKTYKAALAANNANRSINLGTSGGMDGAYYPPEEVHRYKNNKTAILKSSMDQS